MRSEPAPEPAPPAEPALEVEPAAEAWLAPQIPVAEEDWPVPEHVGDPLPRDVDAAGAEPPPGSEAVEETATSPSITDDQGVEPEPAGLAESHVRDTGDTAAATEAPTQPAIPDGYSAETEEPDWYADDEVTWLDAADYAPPEPAARPEPQPRAEFAALPEDRAGARARGST